MELNKCSFQDVQFGDECVFRTDKQIVVHAVKVGENRILDKSFNREAFAGQYHEVWQVVKETGKRVLCPKCHRPLRHLDVFESKDAE